MPLQLRILPKLTTAHQAIDHYLPHLVNRPFMVPLLLQRLETIPAKPAAKSIDHLPRMGHFDMLIQHGFEMEHPVTIITSDGRIRIVILHVLRDHFFRVKLALAQIALEIGDAVDFLVFGEIAGVREGLIAERAFVKG